jgi:hypothetical protein
VLVAPHNQVNKIGYERFFKNIKYKYYFFSVLNA